MELAALVAALTALAFSLVNIVLLCLSVLLRGGFTPVHRGRRGAQAAEKPEEDEDAVREEERRSRAINEGFENIMSFRVGGRGGFDGEGFGG